MCQGIDAYPALVDHSAWNANNGAVALYIADNYRSSADSCVGADRDRTQYFCAGPYHDIFGEGWVAFAVFLSCAPKGHSLVEKASVADLGCFTNHDSHAVVNEHAVADAGAGVDLDTGEGSSDLAKAARGKLQR